MHVKLTTRGYSAVSVMVKIAQTGGTLGTGRYMFSNLRPKRRRVDASGQFRQQFANLIAIHTASPTSLKQTL